MGTGILTKPNASFVFFAVIILLSPSVVPKEHDVEEVTCQLDGTCSNAPRDERASCLDTPLQHCRERARDGECMVDWPHIRPLCPLSCWQCVNETALKEYGDWDANELAQRKAYLHQEWGPLPVFNQRAAQAGMAVENMKHAMMAMDVYARQVVMSDPSPVKEVLKMCRNEVAHCPYWVTMGECVHNIHFMMQKCPLACQFCDDQQRGLVDYRTCQPFLQALQMQQQTIARKSGSTSFFKPAGSPMRWKRVLQQHAHVQQILPTLTTSFTRNSEKQDSGDDNDEDGWVFLVQPEAIADDAGWQDIMKGLSPSIGVNNTWKSSSTRGYDRSLSWPAHVLADRALAPSKLRRDSESTSCGRNKACSKHLASQLIQPLTRLLQLPNHNYWERPADFVRYRISCTSKQDSKPGNSTNRTPFHSGSFGKHHDFRMQDGWKASGYRLLTLYLALSGPSLTMGFPDWNWTMVQVPPRHLLIWPNVQPDGRPQQGEGMRSPPYKPHPRTASEVMPWSFQTISEKWLTEDTTGEETNEEYHVGIYLYVRLYEYNKGVPEVCR